jgi:hypothetical protein
VSAAATRLFLTPFAAFRSNHDESYQHPEGDGWAAFPQPFQYVPNVSNPVWFPSKSVEHLIYMCKRIASILVILLGYIALAGATHNLIKHFSGKPTQQRYVELRVGSSHNLQAVICKDWVHEPDATDSGPDDDCDEVSQDIYYWINLEGANDTGVFTKCDLHANGPMRHRNYQGTINLDREHRQLLISLYRLSTQPGERPQLIPSPANGTYPIRQITKSPFLKDDPS